MTKARDVSLIMTNVMHAYYRMMALKQKANYRVFVDHDASL